MAPPLKGGLRRALPENDQGLRKKCRKCGLEKLFEAFRITTGRGDGRGSKCKACVNAEVFATRIRKPPRVRRAPEEERAIRNERARAKRALDPFAREKERAYEASRREEIRAYKAQKYERARYEMLARNQAWKDRSRQHISEYNKAHYDAKTPEYRARRAVTSALASGALRRAESCNRCGAPPPLDGHHHSYAREHWLDVEWLCRTCHLRHHAQQEAV